MIKEEDLVEYAKTYLKPKGFKKKNKRWTKDIGEFTLVFYIQGSCWDKEDYYIRPGVFMNGLQTNHFYGHFVIQINNDDLQEIFIDFEHFCEEWTNKALIKQRTLDFIAWESRNPLERRRAKLVDYVNDPPPTKVLFHCDDKDVLSYIVNNF